MQNVGRYTGNAAVGNLQGKIKEKDKEMTLQEAIKSNKPFKRPHYIKYLWKAGNDDIISLPDEFVVVLRATDVLANDWEIKDEIPATYT